MFLRSRRQGVGGTASCVHTDATMHPVQSQPRHLSTALRRNLPGLMALYEENYIRLRRLIPRMPQAGDCEVSRVDGCVDLHLEVLDRAPYTTSLRLTYRLDIDGVERDEPDLLVRIHHDARTADAVEVHMPRGRYQFDARRTLHRCWERNRFLHRWLGYCLHRGHRFESSGRAVEAVSSDG